MEWSSHNIYYVHIYIYQTVILHDLAVTNDRMKVILHIFVIGRSRIYFLAINAQYIAFAIDFVRFMCSSQTICQVYAFIKLEVTNISK